jgi:CarD family transcriptional regulator
LAQKHVDLAVILTDCSTLGDHAIMREEKVFNIGDKVIHPSYGAGTILEINEKQVGEQQCTYYIIDLLTQAGTLMVPVSRADELGLRLPVERPDHVMTVLNSKPETLSNDHRERQESISTDIRSGDVVKISEAVRDLAYRDRADRLTEADLKLYRAAQDLLVGELALSQDVDMDTAREQVTSVLESLATEDESV